MIRMSFQQILPTKKIIVPSASSDYPKTGSHYWRGSHEIGYSPRLKGTYENYYDSRPKDGRMSTAAEELAIQLDLERLNKDPKTAGVFDDVFARNELRVYIRQWTETGLRVPKNRDPDKYETDTRGRKYYAREVLIGDEAVGDILVPEGHYRVVVEWDNVFGIPLITEYAGLHSPYTTHFAFDPSPWEDTRSGHRDVAVRRSSFWHSEEGGWCLLVDAHRGRFDYFSDKWMGFRPVQGSLPKIEKSRSKHA